MINRDDAGQINLNEVVALRGLVRTLLADLPKKRLKKMLDDARDDEAALPDREMPENQRAGLALALAAQTKIIEQSLSSAKD